MYLTAVPKGHILYVLVLFNPNTITCWGLIRVQKGLMGDGWRSGPSIDSPLSLIKIFHCFSWHISFTIISLESYVVKHDDTYSTICKHFHFPSVISESKGARSCGRLRKEGGSEGKKLNHRSLVSAFFSRWQSVYLVVIATNGHPKSLCHLEIEFNINSPYQSLGWNIFIHFTLSYIIFHYHLCRLGRIDSLWCEVAIFFSDQTFLSVESHNK